MLSFKFPIVLLFVAHFSLGSTIVTKVTSEAEFDEHIKTSKENGTVVRDAVGHLGFT